MSETFWELLTMMFALAMLMIATAFAVCMLYDLNKSITTQLEDKERGSK